MSLALSFNSTTVRAYTETLAARLGLGLSVRLSPERAVAEAARRFLTPPPVTHRERDKAFLAQGRGFVVPSAGVRLAAWRFGEAHRPAVVLSHGWGGRAGQFQAFVPALVAAGWQAVVFDHAGHGRSEGKEASLVGFARALAAVVGAIESQGADVTGLIGHSLGAAAIPVFLRESGRTPRSVLVAPPASLVGYSSFFARRLGLSEALRARMQAQVEHRLGFAWRDIELPRGVASLASPALVIHDEDDRDVRLQAGLAIARAWPGARFVRTSGLGHSAVLRDAGVVRDAIDFLRDAVVFAPPPASGETSAHSGPSPIL